MRYLYPILCCAVLFGCTKQQRKKLSLAEQAQEITEVFESPVVYSVRMLDTAEIEEFLSAHAEYRQDSSQIRAFYKRRGFQYAWFVNDSLSQAAAGFAALVNSTDAAYREVEVLRERLNELLSGTQDSAKDSLACDSCRTALELALTAQFFRFADKKYGGMVGKDLRELDWFIPKQKKNYDRLLDSIAAGRMDLGPVEPLHPQYGRLKAQLKRYFELDTLVRWDPIALGEHKKLEPEDTASFVPDIRERLMVLGDLVSGMDTLYLGSRVYDSTLVAAMKRFQERHGLATDGVIGNGVIRALNVSPAERVRTMLINMERLRWVPETYAQDLILVNIPEFRMHIFENGQEAWNMNVVVGAGATRTVIFSDTLSNIVFSPYWGVPSSIVQNEILPAMKKDPNYLAKKGMERIGGSNANPLIRQKPGAGNALGRVKFLFPNSYNIYFHDTPSKGGFARESRAFSHGCIRLSQPKELAEYLLRDDTTWTAEKIKEAMFSGKETWVKLKEKRPVTIGYFTAWITADGRLNFRDDVYGHDEKLASELFFDPTPVPVTNPPLTPEEQEELVQ
ncbi:MAG TPA: L,D-transpeptidase family protein [Flavobacteriales bacterium]|nr:L,D-transpeptidase family protein [Flavobacteriales bacterium]